MRHVWTSLLAAGTLLSLLWPAPVSAAAPPGRDPAALEAALRMLHLEYKQRVLETYHARAGFYIPPRWPRSISAEFDKVSAEMHGSATNRLKQIDDWVEASEKARKNEVEAMYKTAEDWIGKVAKALKSDLDRQQTLLQWREFLKQPKKSSVEVARFVEGLLQRPYLASKGPESDPRLAALSLRWHQQAREVYRGAVQDTDNLIRKIADFDNQRREIEVRLQFLKHVETGLEAMKTVRQPGDRLLDKLEESAQAKTIEWLRAHYTDIDDHAVKQVWGEAKGLLEGANELRTALQALDEDPDLKENDAALSAARRFTVLATLYKGTLGKIRDLPGAKAFGPALDILDFYGKALALVPELTRKTQAMVRRVDQGHHGVRALDRFNVVGKDPGGLVQVEGLRERFGLLVARDAAIDADAADVRYYMLVDEKVMPRKFATLSGEQYARLLDVIAYERFLNAPREAWRMPTDWVAENMFEWRSTSILSARASDAYLVDLKARVNKTPFSEKALLQLAQGMVVETGGKTWTHEKLANLADAELDARAHEQLLRSSAGGYSKEGKARWESFLALLRRHEVALAPQQIKNLYDFYCGEGGSAHVEAYLAGLGKERAARAQGRVAVGVPLVTTATPGESATPGQKLDMSADVLLSDLEPGRVVDALVRWELPEWGKPPAPATIKLGNGLRQLPLTIEVPRNIDLKPFEARLVVQVEGQADITAVVAVQASLAASTRPAVDRETPPAPRPTEYVGVGSFEVEASTGDVQISLRRLDDARATGIEVVSSALGALTNDSQGGVRLRVYVAEKSEGPWEMAFERTLWERTEQVEPSKSGFIGRDRYMLLHTPGPVGETRKLMPPFHYRVLLAQMNSDMEPVGSEAKSNIAGPRGAFVRILTRTAAEGVLEVNPDRWCTIELALSCANQYADARRVQVKAQTGGWTGYFNSARREDGVEYFLVYGSTSVGTGVAARVPYRPEGGSVTLEAVGDGMQASTTVKLPVDELSIAAAKREAELIARQTEAALAHGKDLLPKLKQGLADAEARDKEKKPPEKFSYAHSDAQWKMGIARQRAEVLKYEQVHLPGLAASGKRAEAEALRDWPAALAATAGDEDRARLAVEIAMAEAREVDAATAWALGFEGDFSNLRASYERDRAEVPRKLEQLRRGQLDGMCSVQRKRAELAFLAGDAGAYVAARQREHELQVQLAWRPDTIAGFLQMAANEGSVLSADRGQAKAWWDKHEALTLEALTAQQREQSTRWFAERKPAWYPASR